MSSKKKEEAESDVSSVVSDAHSDNEENEEESNDLNKADIVTKYRTAGTIANEVMLQVLAAIKPEVTRVSLCALGDGLIEEAVGKIYNKKVEGGKKVEKGIAFPTCISVNNCVGHFSPLESEASDVLVNGDVIKVDLGVHVDGYIAVVAHTVMCGGVAEGRKADVIKATWEAAELAHRMFKEGTTNEEITEMIGKVAKDYNCEPVEGVLSHQMKKHVIDANKVIINKTSNDQKVAKCTIDKNDVFAIDIVMSTGEGKPKQRDLRTTVYKRNLSEKYSLKMKASRAFFSEVNQRFPTMPFTLRAGDERKWKMGVVECVKHDLFTEYPVLFEKDDAFVAQYKFTGLLLPSGNAVRLTGAPPPEAKSELAITEEALKELMLQTTEKKKKKTNNKKKKSGGAGGEKDEE